MTQSSASPSIQGTRGWVRRFAGTAPDWGRIGQCVRGPLATLGAAVLLDVLRRQDVGLDSPFPILILTVVYSAYVGGVLPALVSVAFTVLNALHFFAQPGLPLHYTQQNAASLLAVAASALLAGLVVARLRERLRQAQALELSAADAEALARRFAFLEQAALILSSARNFEAIFRDLARLIVPTLSDWCTIHLAGEDGTLRYVAGAHRDPSRDFVVRALAGYGGRALPFGETIVPRRVVELTDDLLRAAAADDEELKLYRALAPASVLRLPLLVRDRICGMLTLVQAAGSGRRFPPADVELAEELAQGTAVAVENARLRQEAHEADRRSRLVFESHPQPMWIFDTDTLAFLAVNDAAVHHYGYTRDEFLGMTIMDLLPPEDAPPQAATDPGHGTLRGETALAHHQRRDGTLVDMEIVSHELELDGRRARLVLATDITDRTRARAALHQSEEQLRHAQRTEALGRIAGGVAHDFNNLLTTIRGFGEMLLRDLVPDDRRRHDVERICQAADRGALLTRQLLSFGRNQAQAPCPVNLNDVVRGMEPLIRRLVGADVALDVRLAGGLGQVRIDPAQLEHVVVNLVLNARDAMPAGGRLTIETAERRISELNRSRPVRPGRYVVLAVGDSGSGPHEETGTDGDAPSLLRSALGRSIVFGIVRQYGGVVRVASEAGEGTTVKVYLPRLDAGAGEDAAPSDADASRGSETVLVAEDEDGVRELLRKILTEFGYTVLTARHGRDALMLAGEAAADIDLLVTDVVMPEMSGRELVQALRHRRPDLKVLYVSGYTDDEILQRGVSGPEVAFLRKPFAAEELVRRVRALLDDARA
ncbi:MAG TPA: response regulator [Gemmatimonadales bacterium]|nr:response regulator [Gemmatimonadales bacterium]